jgi:hypothetical protein
MTTLEKLWPYFLFACAAVMTGYTILTAIRGRVKDEDGGIHHRDAAPRAFIFTQLLQIAGIAILIYVGFGALKGWK